ncbi:MAG: MoaD/ThiS family protein [Acidimicrobiia bacterium]|nr:MoaD/ThiS family protein [Acidimicrobiia bacterium]
MIVVRLASALRTYADGAAHVEVDLPAPVTLRAVLDALDERHPAAGRRLRDEAGALRRHVNLFVGSDDARTLHGLDTVVSDGAEVAVFPAVSGG